MSYQLIQGDCLDVMRGMEAGSVDAVITDPPYLEGDFSHTLPMFLRISSRVVLTPGKYEVYNWIRRQEPTHMYAWFVPGTKATAGQAAFHVLWEPILSYGYPKIPPGSDVFNFPLMVDPMAEGHPWPKPLNLMKYLIERWSKPGDTIFDPFMGSGTTGVAAMLTGRKFKGVELNPEYFAIAKARITKAATMAAGEFVPIADPGATFDDLPIFNQDTP